MARKKELDFSKRDIVTRRAFIDLLEGDMTAAALLSQIVWYYLPTTKKEKDKEQKPHKLRVFRRGVYWIAKTREQWMIECALSRKQYLRVIGLLQRKGIIEIKVMKFRGVTMSHARLLPPFLEKFITEGNSHIPLSAIPIFPFGELLNTESLSESMVKSLGTLTSVSIQQHSNSQSKAGEIEKEKSCAKEKESNGMKAEEILKAKKNAPPVIHGSLDAHWKSRMALFSDGEFQKELTDKEKGQLGQLGKKLGKEKVKELIDFVINNWKEVDYTAHLKENVPWVDTPAIGILLQYHHVFINEMNTYKSAPKLQPIAPKEEQACYSKPKEVVTPHKSTPEEIQAFDAEYELLVKAKQEADIKKKQLK